MNKTIGLLMVLLLNYFSINACSMYKVTMGNKTMVGCNEDAWRTTSFIWFETAKSKDEYGACFTGSRAIGNNQYAPQSGMNEAGLVFSRLGSFHPKKNIDLSSRKKISDPITYLKDILHTCKNIDEVKAYIEQYDHSYFIEDVFIYIEKSGKYLIVEPYKLITGNKPSYVLANFCPSITNQKQARNQNKYRNGEDFLKLHQIDTTFSFCKALSDTMKVCRNRNGDGTLLTSNWDTKNGLVNLFFYHNYDSTIQFNITEELAKGDHIINVANLFPANKEFERLKSYKTPFNTPLLRVSLVFFAGFFLLSSLLYLISYFKQTSKGYQKVKLLLTILGLMMTAYMFVLATNIGIYYFKAPYTHPSNNLINISSYIPFLLALSILPIYLLNRKILKVNNWSKLMKWTLTINSIFYTLFLCFFAYWGLFNVIN